MCFLFLNTYFECSIVSNVKNSQDIWLDYKIYHWSKGKTLESPFADDLPQFARRQTQKTTLTPRLFDGLSPLYKQWHFLVAFVFIAACVMCVIKGVV